MSILICRFSGRCRCHHKTYLVRWQCSRWRKRTMNSCSPFSQPFHRSTQERLLVSWPLQLL